MTPDWRADRAEARLGQLLGFGVAALAILVGGLVAATGHEWAGGATALGSLVALVTVFVNGRSFQHHIPDSASEDRPQDREPPQTP